MVKIGDVFWKAEVRGVGDAQEQASGLSSAFDDVAGSFLGSAAAQEESTQATKEDTNAKQENERWTERLDADSGLLASTLSFLTGGFSAATLASTAYSGAVTLAAGATTLLNGALTTTYALLAGPVGIAAALLIAVGAVGLLGAELLGLTDVTPIVQAETTSMSGAFADMAFLIGGPLVGFLGAAFLALTGDFEGAKNMFINTSVEWVKAAARFAARVQLGFATFGQAVVTGFRATVESMDFAWRAGLNSLLSFINTWVERVRDGIVGGLNSAVQEAIRPLNQLIAKANELPEVDIEQIGTDFQLAETRGRQTGRLSTIQNEGLDSRLSRVRRQGRQNIARRRERTRAQLAQFAPDTIGPGRRTRTGLGRRARLPGETAGGGGGARQGPQKQEVNVDIGDQSLDLSDLSRGQLRRLAELIGDELGSSTTDIAGAR